MEALHPTHTWTTVSQTPNDVSQTHVYVCVAAKSVKGLGRSTSASGCTPTSHWERPVQVPTRNAVQRHRNQGEILAQTQCVSLTTPRQRHSNRPCKDSKTVYTPASSRGSLSDVNETRQQVCLPRLRVLTSHITCTTTNHFEKPSNIIHSCSFICTLGRHRVCICMYTEVVSSLHYGTIPYHTIPTIHHIL